MVKAPATPPSATKPVKPDAPAEVVQIAQRCPYSGKAINTSVPPAEFAGQKVGFCCAGCAQNWANATDAQRQELLARLQIAK